jgi:hypothetical protein
LAEAFVSVLEKEGLTVAWQKPRSAPTSDVDVNLTVGFAAERGSLYLRLNPVVNRFRARFPRLSIELDDRLRHRGHGNAL